MRGQSAIEYLMTYGWAILALVIIVGIMVTSGIFSPTFLVSEECGLSTNLPCQFALFNQGDQARIAVGVYNSFPYRINITKVQVYNPSDSSEFIGFQEGVMIKSGSNFTFTGAKGGGEIPANTLLKLYANVTYVICSPEVAVPPGDCSDSPHTVSGRITGKVLPAP